MITIKVKDQAMQASLSNFGALVGKDAGKLIPDEARLFFSDMARYAVPKKKGDGLRAVKRSIENAAPEFGQTDDDWLNRAIKAGDVALANKALAAKNSRVRVGEFSADVHRKARDARGRVFRKKSDNVLIRRADIAERNRHIAKKRKNVGMVKGAFAWLAKKCGTGTGGRIASWITGNAERGAAWLGASHSMRTTGTRPFVKGSTGTHPESLRVFKQAFANRVKSLNRKALNIVKGRAAVINGKYTILKSDRGDQ